MFGAAKRLDEIVDVVRVLKEERDPVAACDMLVATVAHGETLYGYVERTHAGAPQGETLRAYRRVRQERGDLLASLRHRLGDGGEKVEETAQEMPAPSPRDVFVTVTQDRCA